MLRRFPCIPLPSESGLRQPIHSSQLAAVALKLTQQLCGVGWDSSLPDRISLGGDTTLSYADMVRLAFPSCRGDASCAQAASTANRLFFALATPLVLCSPKAFEAVLRMGANLSGFTPANHLLGREREAFPVLPLS